jgi:hypothetical protein
MFFVWPNDPMEPTAFGPLARPSPARLIAPSFDGPGL